MPHCGNRSCSPLSLIPSPETIAHKVAGVVDHFAEDGLTRKEYLRVALKRPMLIVMTLETIAHNFSGVLNCFAADGLTRKAYLQAALKQPTIFSLSPEIAARNVIGVVDRFADDGLTRRDYLRAALKQPALFSLTPETVAHNIDEVVDRFANIGMTRRDYVNAALRQPSLFTQTPETIIRHIDTVIDFADRGLFVPPPRRRTSDRLTTSSAHNSHAAVLAFLITNPVFLSLADDNFGLREVHHRLTDGPTNSTLLAKPRHAVERELMEHLGHDDPQRSVPADGFIAGEAPPTEEQAKRFLLRALIHAGFVRGGSVER